MSAEMAKAAINEVASDTTRKYNISEQDAKNLAERSFVSTEQRLRNQRADMEIAAKVFRGMFLARQGKPGVLAQALDDEAAHYKRAYGREVRSSMTLGTDSTGGYLAPTYFSDMLYEKTLPAHRSSASMRR